MNASTNIIKPSKIYKISFLEWVIDSNNDLKRSDKKIRSSQKNEEVFESVTFSVDENHD